jgi:hypothetical protein
MLSPVERRSSPRWDAVKNHSAIEFQKAGSNRRMGAVLLNIGRHGALVSTEEIVPLEGYVFFRIESPVKTDWIRAYPVRHAGRLELGLRFHQPCLDDLLLAAMMGIDLGAIILEGGRPTSFDDSAFGA